MNNKWIRGAIPALLIHCSIGTVYCWSLLRNDICEALGCQANVIEWAFSLAIFFLGMSAAFGGNLVEKNVRASAIISTVCFVSGMVGTGVAIAAGSVFGVLLCYGAIMGVGLGIGYLTPVKTLMMWFDKHKGLATGIAITGFGLAKVIASPVIEYLLSVTTVANVFYILGSMYCIAMCIGAMLIKKPSVDISLVGTPFNIKSGIKFIANKQYLAIWAVFFINIACGLALISQEKSILQLCGLGASVALISSLTATCNAIGRFGYSTLSDALPDRGDVYSIILLSSAWFLGIYCLDFNSVGILLIILFVCNAGYGGGFSTLPSLLSDKFGMQNVSVIHGFALSAWAWAGLVGNHMGYYLINEHGVIGLFVTLMFLYAIALIITVKYIVKS